MKKGERVGHSVGKGKIMEKKGNTGISYCKSLVLFNISRIPDI